MSNRYEERPVGPASAGGLWLQVLGPLRIWRGNVELDAGPPQQALLLAILLAREGRPVSRNELIDLIWGDDVPQTAHNVIHKYVGVIRRLMEPSLAPRATGSHLVRRGNAYLFLAEPGMLDLGVFRTSVRTAEVARSEQRHDAALAAYLDALQLWRGEAGAGLDLDPAAMPIFVGLNREFLDACVSAAEVAVSIGRPERLVAPLELAAAMAPLHEPVHASLMSILAAAGQQAEALAVHRAIRVRLVEQLGIDPGELLETTYRQVVAPQPARASARLDSPGTVVGSHSSTLGQSGLVGRERDLSLLTAAIEPAFTGASGLAVVEGEPGVGKTRLLEELDVEATRRGARVIWAHCHDGDGTPALWPWVLVVRALLDDRSHAARADWPSAGLGELLDPSTDALTATVFQGGDSQFRMFQRVVDLIGRAAVTRPLVVLLDDLQWADIATLHLYSHLLGQLPRGVAVVSALRDRAPMPGEDLARALAGVSRAPGHRRLRLAPLDLPDVAELVRNLTDVEPHPDRVRDIHMRTGGNPFFVREVARGGDVRVHSVNDAAGVSSVPTTVRDVVRDRIAHLDASTTDILVIAALMGSRIDIDVLAAAGGIDVQTCLDRLEPLEALGVLHPSRGDPFTWQFAHDIVRESVQEAMPQRQASLVHLRIADAIGNGDGASAPERLAHHLWAAGPLADPARTIQALVRAGRRAVYTTALEAAAQRLHQAVDLARRAGLAELELASLSELAAVAGMKAMYGTSALELLERAELLARDLGRDVEATGFLFTRWAVHAQGLQLDRSGPLARRLLNEGEAAGDQTLRAYGLNAWGIHQWAIGNIDEALRHLSEAHNIMKTDLVGGGGAADRDKDPVGYDLGLLVVGLFAETTAIHGDVDHAWELLDAMEAGTDDPYTITVACSIKARIAALAGEPVRAVEAVTRGTSTDPEWSFVFLGTYQRLAGCWARALSGEDVAAAVEEAQRIIATNLLNPTRSCVATWFGLLGEMFLVAGAPDEAADALDRGDACLDAFGQRYSEALLLLIRARLLEARGEPPESVREVAARARALAEDRGAHLFARRADALLAALAG